MDKKTIKSRDGHNLYYETHFKNNKKPTLFFVHGLGGDLDAWQFIAEPLRNQGFSTVAMDIRGHGYSSHPKGKHNYRLDRFVEDIEETLKAEKLNKVVIIGHSFGATIATLFALKNPAQTHKLVAMSTNYHPPAYVRNRFIKAFSSLLSHAGARLSPPPTAGWHSTYPPGKLHSDVELLGLARTIYHNSLRSYLLSSLQIQNINLLGDLPKIKVPTLVVVGEKDSLYKYPASKIVHQKIPGSTLAVIKDANHVLPMNNAEEIAKLIQDFL